MNVHSITNMMFTRRDRYTKPAPASKNTRPCGTLPGRPNVRYGQKILKPACPTILVGQVGSTTNLGSAVRWALNWPLPSER